MNCIWICAPVGGRCRSLVEPTTHMLQLSGQPASASNCSAKPPVVLISCSRHLFFVVLQGAAWLDGVVGYHVTYIYSYNSPIQT